MVDEGLVTDEKVDVFRRTRIAVRADGESPHDDMADPGGGQGGGRDAPGFEHANRDDIIEERRIWARHVVEFVTADRDVRPGQHEAQYVI
jgi:hypothetical protein